MRNPLTNRSRAIPLRLGWLILIGFALASMLLLSAPLGSTRVISTPSTPTPTPCTSDLECSDGVFCNGIERCAPDRPGADPRGCVPAVPPSPCVAGQDCEEASRQCVIAGCEDADHDGDGHRSFGCGGDDCDDQDPNRFPGRTEVCDATGHDEDCDPSTYGDRDQDGDGEDDSRCFNTARNGTIYRGTDYDDNNPAIRKGSMICDGPDAVVAFVAGPSSLPCPTGTNCVMQPNKTGICVVPPVGYVPPARFTPPGQQPSLAALPPESLTPIRPAGIGPSNAQLSRIQSPVPLTNTSAATDSPSGDPAEVAECKSTLQSGKVSWGRGTTWESGNIEKLCNGTKNAKKTITCFELNVEALGWAAAIDRCR